MNPKDIINKVALKMRLHADIVKAAHITVENFTNQAIMEGKRPQTIAGTSLLMVMGHHRLYKDD